MSPLTRQMWIDAWAHLTSARQSFGEASTSGEQERSLCDMVMLCDAFKASCLSLAGIINYEAILKRRRGDS